MRTSESKKARARLTWNVLDHPNEGAPMKSFSVELKRVKVRCERGESCILPSLGSKRVAEINSRRILRGCCHTQPSRMIIGHRSFVDHRMRFFSLFLYALLISSRSGLCIWTGIQSLVEWDPLFSPRQPSSSHKLDSVRFFLSTMSTSDTITSLLLLGSDGQHSQVSVGIRMMIRILVGDSLFSISAP